jgi:hypothetical protein
MNKSFVIVGPDATEAEGRQLMQALKVSHRQYDFELYEPYGTNTNYGIMMASWVSKQRAAEALQAAKQIERTSFIWECSATTPRRARKSACPKFDGRSRTAAGRCANRMNTECHFLPKADTRCCTA